MADALFYDEVIRAWYFALRDEIKNAPNLKDCPRCGGKGVYHINQSTVFVRCIDKTCHAETALYARRSDQSPNGTEKVAHAWNNKHLDNYSDTYYDPDDVTDVDGKLCIIAICG